MWETIRRSLSMLLSVPLGYSITIVVLFALGLGFASARWGAVLAGLGRRVRLSDVLLTNLAFACVNNLTPGRVGGEVFRVALLRSRAELDTKRAAASAVYDRLIEAAQLPIFLLLALPAAPQLTRSLGASLGRAWRHLPLLVGLLVLLAGAALAYRRASRLRAWLRRYIEELATLAIGRRHLAASMAFAALVWALDALRLMVAARAFGVSLTPSQALALSISTITGSLVPAMGGLGVVEGTLVAVLCLYGVHVDKALAIALLDRAVSYGLVTCVGACVLLALGGGRLLRTVKSSPPTVAQRL